MNTTAKTAKLMSLLVEAEVLVIETRKVEARAAKVAERAAARAAARRLDRLSLRAATSAAQAVEKISQRLGETSLTPAAETDRTLAADEIPAVEEIELHAARYATLD
ncbi:hypothetical protein ACWGOK_43115, partial [Streptomyces eurythermus]